MSSRELNGLACACRETCIQPTPIFTLSRSHIWHSAEADGNQ